MSRWKSVLCVAVLVLLAGVLSWGHVWRYTTVSPIDELQHLDYLIKVQNGEMVGNGDLFGQSAMRIETCHRLDAEFDVKIQPCATGDVLLVPQDFQESGFNTASIHPPTYYAIDGVVARVIDRVLPGEHDWLTTGRLAGSLWLMAAAMMLWFLFRELLADRIVAFSLTAALIASPTVLHAVATINPDGTALFIGAAILWAVVRWERSAAPFWLPVAVAAFAAATKVTNLVAVALVLFYLLGRVAWKSRPGETNLRSWVGEQFSANKRLFRMMAAILGAVGVVSVVWLGITRVIESLPASEIPMVARYRISSFPFEGFVESWRQTVSPLSTPYLTPFLRNDGIILFAGLVAFWLLGAAVASTIRSAPGSRSRMIGCASLLTIVLAGPALVVFNSVIQGIYVVVPTRYALAAVPALAASGLPVASTQVGRVVLSVLASGMAVSVLGAIIFS
jgi:hypothetical protein